MVKEETHLIGSHGAVPNIHVITRKILINVRYNERNNEKYYTAIQLLPAKSNNMFFTHSFKSTDKRAHIVQAIPWKLFVPDLSGRHVTHRCVLVGFYTHVCHIRTVLFQ